jgi:hypothetical protein
MENLFDSAHASVLRDISRSLTQFQSSPLFLSISNPANKAGIEAVFESQKSAANSQEVMARVRYLYNTSKTVKLEEINHSKFRFCFSFVLRFVCFDAPSLKPQMHC